MKTILINRTLTTIALLSTIQCGWGAGSGTENDPIVLTSWSNIAIADNSTCDNNGTDDTSDDVYTLKAPASGTKYYEIAQDSFVTLVIEKNLVIPEKVGVTNTSDIVIQHNGSLTISGGTFTNAGWIIIGDKGSLTLSGGTFTNTNSIKMQDYGKFSVGDNITHHVTLNGTIAIQSENACVNTTYMNFFPGTVDGVNKDSTGTIDMSPLRPYPKKYSDALQNTQTFDNHNFFIFVADQTDNGQLVKGQDLPNIKLPFNCKFNTTLDLSNAAKVYYTALKIAKIGVVNESIQKTVNTYGDYANDSNLGVTLPSTTDVTTKIQGNVNMSLSALAADTTTYNILGAGYKLWTNDLDDATHEISEDTSYNFGFIGTTPIEISGSGKAVFNGINSNYIPKDEYDNPVEIILPNNVEFGANESLFRFTETYGHGTFSAGNYINVIPSGKTVTFTNGFTLGKGHTLIVRGTLIG